MDAEKFSVTIAGLRRDLPIVEISKGKKVALFQMLGDVELCEAVARAFVSMNTNSLDYIVTPALKSIPLAHEIARITGKQYIVLQKEPKPYMVSPIFENVQSFISLDSQNLWLDGRDADRIRGGKVWIVDDVLTTGNTLRSIEALIKRAGGQVTERLIVFTEGEDAQKRSDIISLGTLPIF